MEITNEAVIPLAKCKKTHKLFGIRTAKLSHQNWDMTWAFPIKENSAKREGYDKVFVQGSVNISETYPGCPYCGAMSWVSCGVCKRLTCLSPNARTFTCEWCETKGKVSWGGYGGFDIYANSDA